MTPKLASDPRSRRFLCALVGIAGLFALAGAQAAPARLDSEAEVTAFAERVLAYENASLVRWTVVAPTRADAEAKIAAILAKLPADRSFASRLFAQGSGEPGARAFVSPQIGAAGAGGACSWQVWVSDPALPAAEGQTAMVPLASHDQLPVGPKATFRVGHFGLVQSKLYAFDETRPGAIRDLATVSDADIPVPRSAPEDYIVLASARKSAPFLEGVKSALAAAQGERRELGPDYALRTRLLGAGRGIGANIEAVPSSMIARKSTTQIAAKAPEPEDALMETCLYALTPSP